MSRPAFDEGWLETALRELADSDADAQAPPHVERSVRAEFHAHAHGPDRRNATRWWLAAAAAALAVWTVVEQRVPNQSVEPAAADDDESFLALVEGEPLAGLDAVQVVRVRLPASALPSLGGPAGVGADDTVDAQVILGQDGIARAIRFVE